MGRNIPEIHARKTLIFFGYLVGLVLATMVVGQKLAIPAYVAIYLIRKGKYTPTVAFGYAGVAYALLIIFYDRVMHLFWYPSWMSRWLPDLLPTWLPSWLFV